MINKTLSTWKKIAFTASERKCWGSFNPVSMCEFCTAVLGEGEATPWKIYLSNLETTLSSVMALVRTFLRLQTVGWDGDILISWAGAEDRWLLLELAFSVPLTPSRVCVDRLPCLNWECQRPEGALHTQIQCVCMLSSSRYWILWI